MKSLVEKEVVPQPTRLYDELSKLPGTLGCLQLKTDLFDHVIDVVGNVEGCRILDIGCGDGILTRKIAHLGASVLGIDKSASAIRKASKRATNNSRFIQADAARYRTSSPFDLVIAFFLLNELTAKTLVATLKNINRSLRASGRFVFVIPHPAFAFSEQTSLVERRKLLQADYFKEGKPYEVRFTAGVGGPIKMTDHHFSLSFVINNLLQFGFAIRQIKEIGYGKLEPSLPFYLLVDSMKK